MKQKDINQKFQKFTCKPQLLYYVCLYTGRRHLRRDTV